MQQPFSKADVQHYFDQWHALKVQIEQMYVDKNSNVKQHVQDCIVLFRELLKDGGKVQSGEGQLVDKLMPLNGEERLQFIEQHLHHRHAFIQLCALFEETEKKSARLTITERNRI